MEMERYKYIGMMLVALLLIACTSHDKAAGGRSALRVRTVVVTKQAGLSSARYVGTIVPIREVPLSLQTTGRITDIGVRNGERIRKGRMILQVDSTQVKNAVQSAKAALLRAQDGYERVKQVHSKGVVTDQKMVEVESQLAQAKAIYDAAQQQLDECTLLAPCDGVVSGLDCEKGQNILPGKTLCSIIDLRAFQVKFTVPEAEIAAVNGCGQVTCTSIGASFPITVTEKSLSANPLTHTYDVTARVEGGEDRLLPGMVAKVEISGSAEQAEDEPVSVIVPASCILMKQTGPTVWVVEQGKAARRDITIDGYQADGVKVLTGLADGDTLVTDGYQKLYQGCPLIIEE